MKKKIFPLIMLLSSVAFAQNEIPLGQGVIKVEFSKLPTLKFYNDTNQITPNKTLTIGKDKDGEFIIKNRKQVDDWFSPEQLSLEYDIFIIRVDTSIGKWYKVIMNAEKNTALWTKAEPFKKFIKWPTFLLNETTAIEKGFMNLDIKTAPSETSKTIKKIETKDCFEVLEIKGDWMRIRTNTKLDCNESNKPVKSGWLKWRDKKRLTISFGLTC